MYFDAEIVKELMKASELEKIPIIAKGLILAGGLMMLLTMNQDEHLRFIIACVMLSLFAIGLAGCGILAEKKMRKEG